MLNGLCLACFDMLDNQVCMEQCTGVLPMCKKKFVFLKNLLTVVDKVVLVNLFW